MDNLISIALPSGKPMAQRKLISSTVHFTSLVKIWKPRELPDKNWAIDIHIVYGGETKALESIFGGDMIQAFIMTFHRIQTLLDYIDPTLIWKKVEYEDHGFPVFDPVEKLEKIWRSRNTPSAT